MRNKSSKKKYIKKDTFKKKKTNKFKKSSKNENKKLRKKKTKTSENKLSVANNENDINVNLDEFLIEETNPYKEFVNIFGNSKNNGTNEAFSDSDDDNESTNDYNNENAIIYDIIDDDDAIDIEEDDIDDDIASDDVDDDDDADDDEDDDDESHADDNKNGEILSNELVIDKNDYRECEIDDEEDLDDVKSVMCIKDKDPFVKHLEKELDESLANLLLKPTSYLNESHDIEDLGLCKVLWREETGKRNITFDENIQNMHVKKKILDRIDITNAKFSNNKQAQLSSQQLKLFCIINSYQDLCHLNRSYETAEDIRIIYCLHTINHILKTRSRVIAHNSKIKSKRDNIPDEFRDQGFTRPKVLIILPFRDSAYKVVNIISSLLDAEKGFLSNKDRFLNDFFHEDDLTKRGHKPEDFESIFTGNTDDHFRIGIGIAKKSVKLYTDFYSSDIILASPLGLRTIIGSEDDKEKDYDFLSSIELLVIDQADIFFMQNWDHILELMKHLHLQPTSAHGVNFSRVRMSYINGWSSLYRQTLIFSHINSPEINALFSRSCQNYEGKIIITKSFQQGLINNIVIPLPQVFRKFEVDNYLEVFDKRFEFFITKILPELRSGITSGQTMIFISSYFDFVRLRNYFTREEINFAPLCEYAKEKEISKFRQKFFHKKVDFMLYTERFHFFHRYRIKGVKHIVFYELPLYPHFYHECCNNMSENNSTHLSSLACTVLFSKYDVQRLNSIAGVQRTSQMLTSDKDSFLFVSNS